MLVRKLQGGSALSVLNLGVSSQLRHCQDLRTLTGLASNPKYFRHSRHF
jgi:hypothetical protein